MNLNKKLNFLFIARDKYPPFRVDISVLFGKEFVQRGHKIDFLLQSDKEITTFSNVKWMNSRVFLGPTNNGNSIISRLHKYLLSLINDLRMFYLIKSSNYDFVQVKDKFIIAILALIIAKAFKKKFFFWLSYPFPESDIYEYRTGTARYPKLYYIRGILIKFLLYYIILPFSDHVFVQSDRMKLDVESHGISPHKISPVPMGVDVDDYSFPIGIDQNSDNNYIITYIGEMEKIRRIDFLLDVFKIVNDRIPNTCLYMIGGSSESTDLDFLKLYAKKLNISKSTLFTGMLPRNEALKFVFKSTVCLSPIYPNPIYIPSSPTKIVEYMLAEKPVVANDIPEQLKIIKESRAGLCVKYSKNLFAEAIVLLLSNPDLCETMGKRGKKYVLENREYSIIADSLEKTYYNLIYPHYN